MQVIKKQCFRAKSAPRALLTLAASAAGLLLASCSGGASDPASSAMNGTASLALASVVYSGAASSTVTLANATNTIAAEKQVTTEDAARFLSQATFGITSETELNQIRAVGYERWLEEQFKLPSSSILDYVNQQTGRTENNMPTDEMAYEGIWQQWLYSPAQLRARVAFALSQIMVVSNVSPELNGPAVASYMDMLNKNAFANYRTLLEDVTLHPAMGYYLNMMESEKEDPDRGTHPNENYAREVLQLFSIGLVKLKTDGSPERDAAGKPISTYDEDTVKGFAKAFSGWSFGGRDTAKNDAFHSGKEDWTVPMQPWASKHSTSSKTLLNGTVLQAGQTPRQDMSAALDNIFFHPNVGPFISRRLIQRLVTSNPSPEYIGRVAGIFNNNGAGVRGDLKAVINAILLDPEARTSPSSSNSAADAPGGAYVVGKMREPVIRFANVLRLLNAKSDDGTNRIHYLDKPDYGLGQSPMLAPSVFNFYSPDYRAAGELTKANLVAPEFQITTETTIVGSLNFLSAVIRDGGYGDKETRLKLDFTRLNDASDTDALINRINVLLMNSSMSPNTRTSFLRVINGIDPKNKEERVKAALVLTMASPEFVIQK
jgi:uncharacterized protein (DUF1800 family)